LPDIQTSYQTYNKAGWVDIELCRIEPELYARDFAIVKVNLGNIKIFHTDLYKEFKNQLIEETLETHIKRSLSIKWCPYDNAVAETTFKLIKTEFVKGKVFRSIE